MVKNLSLAVVLLLFSSANCIDAIPSRTAKLLKTHEDNSLVTDVGSKLS